MRTEGVGEWTIGASGVVGVVSCGGRRGGGVRVGKLLMMLLLHQIMIPVILLPLRVHGGGSKCHWIVGRGAPVVGLSKLNMRVKVSEWKLNQKAASAKHGTVKNLACCKRRKKKLKQKKTTLRGKTWWCAQSKGC